MKDKIISEYMSEIGRRGGKKGGKKMTPARLAANRANARKPRPGAWKLTISRKLYGGEREFRLGRSVAYGIIEKDGDGYDYALTHAPDQDMMDAVAAALDAATDSELAQLLGE